MSRSFKTPQEAEAAFYRAIEQADIKAMSEVWSSEDRIVCVHPGAPRIEGRRAVLDSYAELFSEASILRFSIIHTLVTRNDSLAVHLVREEVELDGEVVSVMVSTNIYHVENGGWRMLLHHASPEPDFDFAGDYDDFPDYDDDGFDDFDEDLDELEEPQRPPVLH